MDLFKDKNRLETELEIALTNRAFEIQLFWQRSNYFLVLITALGVGVFTINNTVFALLIAIFGALSSLFWFRTNLGSKFWQESWEVEVTILAKELGIRSFEKNISKIEQQVIRSLSDGGGNNAKSFFRKWIDRLIVKKYSVTYYMIILSFAAMLIWLIILAVFISKLVADVDWCLVFT